MRENTDQNNPNTDTFNALSDITLADLIMNSSQEAVPETCSVKKVFLKILRESCNFIRKETLAQVFSCEFCKISKNTFSYRTPLVAASSSPEPLSLHVECFQDAIR